MRSWNLGPGDIEKDCSEKMDASAELSWSFDDMEKENKGEYRDVQVGLLDLRMGEFLVRKTKPFTARSATLTVVWQATQSSFNVSLCPWSRFPATVNAISSSKIAPTVKIHTRVIRKQNRTLLTSKPKSCILVQRKDSSWVSNKVARWMRRNSKYTDSINIRTR